MDIMGIQWWYNQWYGKSWILQLEVLYHTNQYFVGVYSRSESLSWCLVSIILHNFKISSGQRLQKYGRTWSKHGFLAENPLFLWPFLDRHWWSLMDIATQWINLKALIDGDGHCHWCKRQNPVIHLAHWNSGQPASRTWPMIKHIQPQRHKQTWSWWFPYMKLSPEAGWFLYGKP